MRIIFELCVGRMTSRRIAALRVICALLLATFFVAAQTLHVAAAVQGPCYLKAAKPKPACAGRTGQHSTHHGGCCCDRSTPCDCDLNQGSNNEGSALPITAATNAANPTYLNALAVPTRSAIGPYSPEKALCPGWMQARAPSETVPPNTTKLTC
jgi:hypothetical protein